MASDAFIERWQREFANSTLVQLPGAGHYIQEDAPEEIATAIRAAFAN